jgi:uroporphyrin-III C-methyltransferase
VALVGGGPGDLDLMTVRALRLLRRADVVVHDRLAPRAALEEVRAGAVLVDVGKVPGHHAVPQSGINALIVAHAQAGKFVVRLKGGDPYLFGRGGEEVEACRAAGVPVEVVPGVSSAFAVPAAAGVPVTHRGLARSVTVLTGHDDLSTARLAGLAALGGTIVVLMGVARIAALAAGLRAAGMAGDVPVALVERGWTDEQRTTRTDLAGVADAVRTRRVSSPAVVVIGAVAALADDPTAFEDVAATTAREVVG